MVKALTFLVVSKKHLNFFDIAWIFQPSKQLGQSGVGVPKASHTGHDIHHNPFKVPAVKVLQPRAAVQVHGGIQLFDQSAVVHNQAIILALIEPVGTGDGL